MKTITFFRINFYLFISLFFLSIFTISDEIEEIVVKADWRDIKIIEEDSSVLILNKSILSDEPIKHFESLSYLIPNLNFAASDSRARYFQIRGIGERSGYQGTPNTSVAFLIDDIDYSGQGGIATTFDVDQIEIYRGPQGSRIGANALAGLIYIRTKEPTSSFEGTSELMIGNYGSRSTGIAFGGPISENKNIKYRFAIRKDYSDGFRENIFLNRSDTSKKDELTLRLKLDWDINESSKLKFLVSEVDLDDPADIWTIDGSLKTLSDRSGMDSQKTKTYGVKYFKEFERFEFQSLSSFTDTDVIFSYDADWGNEISHAPYLYDYFSETFRGRQSYGQEFRLVSKKKASFFKKPVDWVVGVTNLKLKENNNRYDDGAYGDPADPYGPYFSNDFFSSVYSSKNFAVFGSLDFFLSDSLKLSVGARQENWKSKYSDNNDESFNPSDSMSGNKISITKFLDQETTIFTSISKGYKQGGFNTGLGLEAGQSSNLIYNPEFLTNYELGINFASNLSDLSYSVVVFYSDREDQQVLISQQLDPSDPNTFSYLTQNAAEGKNFGIESSIDIGLSDKLSLFGSLGFLETEINNWESRPDLEGRAQAHAPRTSYNIGLNYLLSPNSDMTFNLVGKDEFYYSDSHDNKSDSYYLLNGQYNYTFDEWTISLWAKNILDEYYSVRGFYFGNEAPNFEDTLYKRHGDPRQFGMSIKYDFK